MILLYEYYFQSEIETRLESYRGNQGSALLLASHNKLRHELSGKLSELQRVKRDLEVARNQVDILRSNNATASGEDVHPPPPPQPLSAPPSPQSRQLERGAVAIQERRLHELEASERRCDVHAKGKQHKHLYFIHRILKFNSRSYFYFSFLFHNRAQSD